MTSRSLRTLVTLTGVLSAAAVALACDDYGGLAGPEDATGLSVAYGTWTPTSADSCTREIHDSYAVVGPDGKLYPTWHPPVDPATGCTFGHEHGRDPRGSDLYAEVGPIPFALANEAMDAYVQPEGRRHEDHVGHKVEWENDIEMSIGGGGGAVLQIVCDVLTKLHQGSHSKDAFTNNLHEIVYHIRCSDGTGFSATFMAAIGGAGELVASCDRDRHIPVGTPNPANSPSGGGKRAIPDRQCVEQHAFVADGQRSNLNAALRESWEISGRLRTAENRTLVSFSPYYQVLFPSRFFDPAMPDGVGRPIDICYEVMPDGRRVTGDLCQESTGEGAIPDVTYDSPQSRFNGVRRFVDINSNRVMNEGGPNVWYTDPFGNNGRTEPFAGSIRQWVASIDNREIDLHGPVIGRDRDYGHPSVHAPN